MWKRYLVEIGYGADLHGMDVMEAATRAVNDAVSHCCMCGLVETLGVRDLRSEIRVSIKLGVPNPEDVDPEPLKKLMITDNVDVEVADDVASIDGCEGIMLINTRLNGEQPRRVKYTGEKSTQIIIN